MCILFFLKKRESISGDDISHLIHQEQRKLQDVLDELSRVATLVYSDIENKEKNLRELLDEANEKIALLHNVKKSTVEVKSPHTRKQKTTTNGSIKDIDSLAVYDNENKKIFELADRGFNILDIAKIVNKPKGEVELMLHLREVREGQYVKR